MSSHFPRAPLRVAAKSSVLAAGLLAVLLGLALPGFLCLPLCADVELYDIAAWNVLRGGVHYRDIFETNPPGMVWLHMAVRSALGWRSESLRLVDFAVVSAIIAMLASACQPAPTSRGVRIWTALALFGFYFSTPEICHCQRDLWMLLLALVALWLCDRSQYRSAALVLEGLWWGAGLWIKPQLAIPLLTCWLASCLIIVRKRDRPALWLARDAAGLLCGGLLAGAAGLAWLRWSGAWPYFLEVFVDWNREYSSSLWGKGGLGVWLARPWELALPFGPWNGVYLLAIPLALTSVIAAGNTSRSLLGGLFLGWIVQVAFLQRGYLYQLTPLVFLSVIVVVRSLTDVDRPAEKWLRLSAAAALLLMVASFALSGYPPSGLSNLLPGGLAALAILVGSGQARLRICTLGLAVLSLAILVLPTHPVFQRQHLALLSRCLCEGGTPEVKNRLMASHLPWETDWVRLQQVTDFLKDQGVKDREVLCYDTSTFPLYLQLQIQPAVRFMHLDYMLVIFPQHQKQIHEEIAASRPRFVVSDLATVMKWDDPAVQKEIEQPGMTLPPTFPRSLQGVYPWTEPVEFRAGRYVVHRTTRPHDSMR
jgi:hypothetical protein